MLQAAIEAAFPAEVEIGVQAALAVGDGRDRFVSGLADPLEALGHEHAFNLYCGAKPIGALATLAALESGRVDCDPQRPLRELLDCAESNGQRTLGDLFRHEVGFGQPELFQFCNSTAASRAAQLPEPDRFVAGDGSPVYSPVALTWALDRIAKIQLGCSLVTIVDAACSDLHLKSTFVSSADGTKPIGTYSDDSHAPPLPMLHDQLPSYAGSPWNYLIGFYSSASDMSDWGAALLRVMAGASMPGLPTPACLDTYLSKPRVEPARPYRGTLSVMRAHGIEDGSAEALGTFGFVRSSMLYVDRANGISCAVVVRALRLHDLESRLHQWNALIRSVPPT